MVLEIKTDNVAQTEQLGQKLGAQLRGGEVIELVGDVGAGKTTFVRGLAQGLESNDHVSSPTFTVCNIYRGRLTLHHCDFYRLNDDSLIKQELSELIDDKSVVVLEWADEVASVLPADYLKIQIQTVSEHERSFTINSSYEYIQL